MDIATYFFDVALPSSYTDSSVLFPLKECQSNKVIGVCLADKGIFKCWISKDPSFRLEIDTSQDLYFSYKNQPHKQRDCRNPESKLDCFSHGLLSPYKLDETSVKVRVFRNGDPKRED